MQRPRTRPGVETALRKLEPGYARIFERALAVVEADERVRALWLSGSLARGDRSPRRGPA